MKVQCNEQCHSLRLQRYNGWVLPQLRSLPPRAEMSEIQWLAKNVTVPHRGTIVFRVLLFFSEALYDTRYKG